MNDFIHSQKIKSANEFLPFFQIASQLKIFSAAIFSVILLNRSLVRTQWIALCILFIGVCFVQFQPEEEKLASRKHIGIEQNVVTGRNVKS